MKKELYSCDEAELHLQVLIPTGHIQKKKREKFLSQVSLDEWSPRTMASKRVNGTENPIFEIKANMKNVDSAEETIWNNVDAPNMKEKILLTILIKYSIKHY